MSTESESSDVEVAAEASSSGSSAAAAVFKEDSSSSPTQSPSPSPSASPSPSPSPSPFPTVNAIPAPTLASPEAQLREAKATIASLIAQITEYTTVMEQEKAALEDKLRAADADRARLRRELEEAEAKQVEAHQETLRNLTTLMTELEEIEQVNVRLNQELEQEREKQKKAVVETAPEQPLPTPPSTSIVQELVAELPTNMPSAPSQSPLDEFKALPEQQQLATILHFHALAERQRDVRAHLSAVLEKLSEPAPSPINFESMKTIIRSETAKTQRFATLALHTQKVSEWEQEFQKKKKSARPVLQKSPSSFALLPPQLFTTLPHSIACIMIHQERLWCGTADGTIIVYAPPQSTPVATWKAHELGICQIVAVDNAVWSSSKDNTIRVWNAATFSLRRALEQHKAHVTALQRVPTTHTVWSASADMTLCVWRTTGELVQAVSTDNYMLCLAYHAPDDTVWVGTESVIVVWRVAPRVARLRVLKYHTKFVHRLLSFDDTGHVWSCSSDGRVVEWHAATGDVTRVLPLASKVLSLAAVDQGRTVWAGVRDGGVTVFARDTGAVLHAFPAVHANAVTDIVATRDGAHAYSASWDRSIMKYDTRALAPHAHQWSRHKVAAGAADLCAACADALAAKSRAATTLRCAVCNVTVHKRCESSFAPDAPAAARQRAKSVSSSTPPPPAAAATTVSTTTTATATTPPSSADKPSPPPPLTPPQVPVTRPRSNTAIGEQQQQMQPPAAAAAARPSLCEQCRSGKVAARLLRKGQQMFLCKPCALKLEDERRRSKSEKG